MASFVCQGCKKTFTTQKGLSIHTAKVCREFQAVFKCECGERFSSKTAKQHHYKVCSISPTIRAEMIRLKARKEYYKQKYLESEKTANVKTGHLEGIKEGLKHEKTVINKRVNKPRVNIKLQNLPITQVPPFTVATMQKAINDIGFDDVHLKKGVLNLTDFLGKNIISYTTEDGVKEANYVCTDLSRNRFHRLVESREWKDDGCGTHISEFLNTIKEPYDKCFRDFTKSLSDLHTEVGALEREIDKCPHYSEEKYEAYKFDEVCQDKYIDVFELRDCLERKRNQLEARRKIHKKLLPIWRGVEGKTPLEREEVINDIKAKIKEEYYSEAF